MMLIRNVRNQVLGLAVLCLAASAMAADTEFLLQLGSFDSKDKAEQKWQELKSKNSGTLRNMNVHISEVSIFGESASTYRLQAGPVPSRAKATELCDKLEDNGADCLVVETAMLSSDTESSDKPSASVEEAAPAPVAPAAAATPAPEVKSSSVQYVSGREPKFLDEGDVQQSQGAPIAEDSVQVVTPVVPHAKAAPVKTAEADDEDDDEDESPAAARRSNPFAHKHKTVVATKSTAAVSAEPAQPTPPSTPSKPGFFSRLFGSSPKPAPATPTPVAAPPGGSGASTAEGSVNVAEAIRVPLTEGNSATVYHTPTVVSSSGQDSRQMFWAQISYFPDEASAHNFYEEFRNTYPDISDDIRMRITRPYSTGAGSSGRVTLRMGAFASSGDVSLVCSLATERGLGCVNVKSESNAYGMPEGAHNDVPAHFEESAPAQKASQLFWAQLGSYESEGEAWDKWKEIQTANKKAVAKLKAAVSQPDSSSAIRELYRLRVGPFNNHAAATALCGKLEARGEECLVLGEDLNTPSLGN